MKTSAEVVAECERWLRICVIVVLAIFWVPFLLRVTGLPGIPWVGTSLSILMLGGPLLVMGATFWLSVRFLRAIPGSTVGAYCYMLIIACVTIIPFFNVLGPLGCLQQVQRFLGRTPATLPTSLPDRRCRCGGSLKLIGGVQVSKWVSKAPVGFLARFACRQCSRQIDIPSVEIMFLNGVILVMMGSVIGVGWIGVYEFSRQPSGDGFGVVNVVLVLLLALLVTGGAAY